jgi:hypothetical protein
MRSLKKRCTNSLSESPASFCSASGGSAASAASIVVGITKRSAMRITATMCSGRMPRRKPCQAFPRLAARLLRIDAKSSQSSTQIAMKPANTQNTGIALIRKRTADCAMKTAKAAQRSAKRIGLVWWRRNVNASMTQPARARKKATGPMPKTIVLKSAGCASAIVSYRRVCLKYTVA